MTQKPESNPDLQRCLDSPYLTADPEAAQLVDRELDSAREYYQQAQEALEEEGAGRDDISLPAYYAMFKTARALLYSQGYREDGFHCMEIALEALFIDEGRLDRAFISHMKDARGLAGDPEEHVKAAGGLLERASELLQPQAA